MPLNIKSGYNYTATLPVQGCIDRGSDVTVHCNRTVLVLSVSLVSGKQSLLMQVKFAFHHQQRVLQWRRINNSSFSSKFSQSANKLHSLVCQWLTFYEYQTRKRRSEIPVVLITMQLLIHFTLTIQRAVKNQLMCLCSLDTHLFLSCEGMCAGFGGGGLDHSFLRIRLMTAFHLTILHSGKGFLFGFF